MAPVIPFMTEYIWQNLTRKVLPSAPLSVHLSDWPTPVAGFENDGIIEQTALVREAIAVAMRLRNEQQLKVRQPLSKLYICSSAEDADKIRTFEKNILDELNIKAIEYLTDASVLEDKYLTVNFKVAGAVLKQNVNKMKQSLEALSDADMAAAVASAAASEQVAVPGWEDAFDASIFNVASKTKAGIVSAEFQNGSAVIALDTVLTDELVREGLVRDVIRQCQLIRKEAGYEVEQRVKMAISSENAEIITALREKLDYLAAELLADEILLNEALAADLQKDVDIAGSTVSLSVVKA